MWVTALETSPVPASPLERIIAAPSVIRRRASPEVRGAADERHRELPLVDVVGVVGRGEHLGLVDVVDAEALQHLRLGEVADAGLGHDRDRHGLDDSVDHVGVAHPGDAALRADVGGDPLERHHGDRAGVLGDLRLLGGDDVHDDAALEHLGHPALDAGGAGARRRCWCCSSVRHVALLSAVSASARSARSRPRSGGCPQPTTRAAAAQPDQPATSPPGARRRGRRSAARRRGPRGAASGPAAASAAPGRRPPRRCGTGERARPWGSRRRAPRAAARGRVRRAASRTSVGSANTARSASDSVGLRGLELARRAARGHGGRRRAAAAGAAGRAPRGGQLERGPGPVQQLGVQRCPGDVDAVVHPVEPVRGPPQPQPEREEYDERERPPQAGHRGSGHRLAATVS